ncbi:hypothetical protein NMY22_g1598 [Coprinellus aureogranulatus]|nr:hypothetical protein NMY22_g1598 [Coprinellus aureogranulatus]
MVSASDRPGLLDSGAANCASDTLHYESLSYGSAATAAVFKAGRDLSSWLCSNIEFSIPGNFFSAQAVKSDPPPPNPFDINTLPQELIEEIFRQCLHVYTKADRRSGQSDQLEGPLSRIVATGGVNITPFTLAHVCSTWRATVMSTPSLWSKICVFRPQLVDIPLFEFWLEKSSNCPLVLDIMQKVNDEWGSIDEAMHRVLSLAFAHSSRWRSISLLLFDDMEALVSTYPATVSLPSLESFHLHFYKKWTTQGGLHILRMLSSSPALRSAHFGRGICPNPLLIANLPWELLHSVSLGDISLPDLLTALSLATNLESLHVSSIISDPSTPTTIDQRSHILLPSLSTIYLWGYADISPLFNALRLPNLSSLELQHGLGNTASPEAGFTAIRDLVDRSACRMRRLYWNDAYVCGSQGTYLAD